MRFETYRYTRRGPRWRCDKWIMASEEERIAFVKRSLREERHSWVETYLREVFLCWPEWLAVAEEREEVRELVEVVTAVVDRMPEKYRQALRQRCLSAAQPTQVEAAQALGISERTFREREREGTAYLDHELWSYGVYWSPWVRASRAVNERRLSKGSDEPYWTGLDRKRKASPRERRGRRGPYNGA